MADKTPKDQQEWSIIIDSFGGFVPAWFDNSYPFYGNKNQASDMVNADIMDPTVLKPGPDVANLTNGDQNGAVTTLVRRVLNAPIADNVTYGCGGNQYYQVSATAVTNSGGTYPHTITAPTFLSENFNALADGNLSGQNSWAGDNTPQVEGTDVYEGLKAVSIAGSTVGMAGSTYKAGSSVLNGEVSFYAKRSANNDIGGMYFGIDVGATVKAHIGFRGLSGHIEYIAGGSYISTGITYTLDHWYKFTIEWRNSDGYVRMSVDDVDKTGWIVAGSASAPDRFIMIAQALTNGDTGHIDYIFGSDFGSDTGQTVTTGAEDILYYKSKVYVFYNYSALYGDIMQDDAGTINDDWGSTVPTGKQPLERAPHQAINGGDDDAYFANGPYIGAIRANGTLDTEALNFWENSQVVSLTWNSNRVIAAVNRPNVLGSNFNQSGIYYWNGIESSWEGDPIEVSGRIGALYTKNGVTYVWWQDGTDTGSYNFGYIGSNILNQVARFKGSLPLFYQVGEYKGFVAWVSGGLIYLWGARDVKFPVAMSQYCQGKYSTVGGISSPFGELMIGSTDGVSNYSLAKPSGYVSNFTWNTLAFKVGGCGFLSQIDLIQVETDPLTSGAKANFTITYNKGKDYLDLYSIEYSAATNITKHKIMTHGPICEDFRIDIDNDEATNLIKIRSILIKGYYVKDN